MFVRSLQDTLRQMGRESSNSQKSRRDAVILSFSFDMVILAQLSASPEAAGEPSWTESFREILPAA